MILPTPANDYSGPQLREAFATIEQEDQLNHKRLQDVEVGDARLILKSPNGTRYCITVDNSGNLGATAL